MTLTHEQFEERMALATECIARRATRVQCHTLFREKYNLSWQNTDRWIRRARARLEKISALKTADDRIREAIAFYESMIATGNNPERLSAQKALREMLGLDAPTKHDFRGDPIISVKNEQHTHLTINAMSIPERIKRATDIIEALRSVRIGSPVEQVHPALTDPETNRVPVEPKP